MKTGIADRWRAWTQLRYLSSSERRLNRLLWVLFWISVIFAVFQHVLLANLPEKFRGGARIGDLCYDVGIAYALSFFFYLLVVRVPLRRDRRNICRYLGPLAALIANDARDLMVRLNMAAKIEPTNRENTWTNIQETCSRAKPNDAAPAQIVFVSAGGSAVTVFQLLIVYMEKTRATMREIMQHSTYVASDLIDMLSAIEFDSYFRDAEGLWQLANLTGENRVGGENLSIWSRKLFDYLLLVDALDKYQQKYLPIDDEKRPGLIAGSDVEPGPDVSPLSRLMNE
jgi:hypothetical protein